MTRYGIDWDVRAQLALSTMTHWTPGGVGSTGSRGHGALGYTRIVPPAVIPRGAVILLDVGPVSIRLQQPSPASPIPPPAEAP